MDKYRESNRNLWNEWTAVHVRGAHYDVEGFKAGKTSLHALEIEEVGPVEGKSLLHLQCHFGKDTLSWARLGASVTGVDFSDRAIEFARSLAREVGIRANFICTDIYELPKVLEERFDIVFTSYGVIYWLPDLQGWAQVISGSLKPGGVFYIAEFHPVAQIFENEPPVGALELAYPYFPQKEPLVFETHGTYAEPYADVHNVEYGWPHGMGEIVTSLIDAGLRIEFLHEFPFTVYDTMFPFLEEREDGYSYLKGQKVDIPLMFSIRARKST